MPTRPLSLLPATLTPRLRPPAAQRRLALWLATFALFIGALVPTLSRLAAPDGLDAWSTLCQARGSAPADPAGPHEFGDACALCTLAHTTPALLGDPPATAIAIDYVPPMPALLAAVRVRVAQARAPGARGPPVSS